MGRVITTVVRACCNNFISMLENMYLVNFVKKLIQRQKKRTEDEDSYFRGNNNVINRNALSKTSSLPPNLSLNELISDTLESHSSPVKTRRKFQSMKNRTVSPSNDRVKLKSTEHLFFPNPSAKNINSRKLSI